MTGDFGFGLGRAVAVSVAGVEQVITGRQVTVVQ